MKINNYPDKKYYMISRHVLTSKKRVRNVPNPNHKHIHTHLLWCKLLEFGHMEIHDANDSL